MKKGLLLLLALAVIALVAVFVTYGRRQQSPVASATAGAPGRSGRSAGARGDQQRSLADFGITGGPSQTNPRGLLVSGFVSSSEPWPLETLGVKVGDAIISCNGGTGKMGDRLQAALDGLQNRGEKITLVVIRDGAQMTLERSGKLPAAPAPQGQRK